MLANPVASRNETAVLRKGDLLGQLCGSSLNATMDWEDMTTNCGGNKNKLIVCLIYTQIVPSGSISNWLTWLLVAMSGGQLEKLEMEGIVQMHQKWADPTILLLRRRHSDMPKWRLASQSSRSRIHLSTTFAFRKFGLDSGDVTSRTVAMALAAASLKSAYN